MKYLHPRVFAFSLKYFSITVIARSCLLFWSSSMVYLKASISTRRQRYVVIFHTAGGQRAISIQIAIVIPFKSGARSAGMLLAHRALSTRSNRNKCQIRGITARIKSKTLWLPGWQN